MHRLKTRKKAKAAAVEEEVPSVPSLPFLSKKKQQAPTPEKPEVDIDAALPSRDDFRTSLLMPNLAQRFSILKMEQAAAAAAAIEAEKNASQRDAQKEPLYQYPSQQFGNNLSDIAETASLSGSVAYTVRSDEGRQSEDGGVMNRPRGGEGNNLFGGRQKVYRVPNKGLRGTSSMEDLSGDRSLRGGRPLYDEDLPESIVRPKAVDDEHLSLSSARNTGSHEAEQAEYDKKRFTTSSTNSVSNTNTTRLSTAATSINSQQGHSAVTTAPTSVPQSPTASKPRRPLYEQALDQQLQEQKITAMGRLERLASMRRAGAASPTPRGESPVPGSLNNAMTSSSPTSRQPLTRTWSSKRATADFPISPTVEETPEELPEAANLESSAKFSPVTGFDFGIPQSEARDRSLSPEPYQRPSSKAGRRESIQRRLSDVSVQSHIQPLAPHPQSPQLADHPGFRNFSPIGRQERADSQSDYSTSRAASRRQSLDQVAAIEELEKELNSPIIGSARFGPRIEIPEVDQNGVSEPSSPVSITSDVSALSDMRSEATPLPAKSSTFLSPAAHLDEDVQKRNRDSPTLPSGGGLSAMVREHLRSNSDASSIYADSMYTRRSRIEPVEQPVVPASEGGRYEPRRSESSIGNPWQYDDDYESPPNQDEMKVPDLRGSPKAAYQNSMASVSSPPQRYSPPRQSSPSPPPVPNRSPDRPDSRMGTSRPGSAMGSWSDARVGRRPESRSGYRSESRPPPSRPGSRMGRPESRGGNYPDSRMGSRPGSRIGRNSDEDIPAGRNRSLSRTGEERCFSRAGEEEDEAWQQQLASRRQLLQERIQEKVLSMHETDAAPVPAIVPGKQSEGGLRNKASAVFKGSNGKPPRHEGPRSQPPSRPSSRNRHHAFDPLEDEYSLRQTVRGPHPIQPMDHIHPAQRPPLGHPAQRPPMDMHPAQRPPQMHPSQRMSPKQRPNGPAGYRSPPPMHPSQRGRPEHVHPAQRPHPDPMHPSNRSYSDQMHPSQRPPHERPPRPMLNTNQSAPQLRPSTAPGLPHPKHSPSYIPRVRNKMSNEQMNAGRKGENKSRNPGPLAPGWNEMDSPRSGRPGRSHPGTPLSPGTPSGASDRTRPRHRAPRPNGDGYFSDQDPRRMKSPPRVTEDSLAAKSNGVRRGDSDEKQEFTKQSNSSEDSHGRQRGNSDTSPNPAVPQSLSGTDTGRTSPVPFATASAVDPVSLSPKQASPVKHVDARAVAQTIIQINAQFQPARKRAVSKNQISQPTLITKTSSIPTIDLPSAGSLGGTTPTDPPSSAHGGRRRTRADIFANLGKKGDDSPNSPATKSDEEDDRSRKGLTSRLRKSISDGGGLSQRGRLGEMASHLETMPKINKAAIGGPIRPAGPPPGMI